jgi:DNA-directed RNA polymerase subunit F
MLNPIDKKPVTLAEAYEILAKRQKDGELGYEQKLAFEHASKFKKLSAEKAKAMLQELEGMGLSKPTAVKVADILPISKDQLKQVLIIEKRPMEESQVEEIMKIVEKYRGK